MQQEARPPEYILRFFRWFCRRDLLDSIEGDLMELYDERIQQSGKRAADFKFVRDVVILFRPDMIRPVTGYVQLNNLGMFSNYFKIAIRNLLKNKGYSAINISGLAIGMAASILILLWVNHEASVDAFYDKTDRIYRLYSRDNNDGKPEVWGQTPALMAPELKAGYGEVDDAVRFRIVYFLTKVGENRFNDDGAFADEGFLTMFNFPLLRGTPTALHDDLGIVLVKRMAIKLFGTIDCLGQTVIVNETDNFNVTAVIDDLPVNTQFEFDYVLPWNYFTKLGWDNGQTWAWTNAATYVLMKPNTDITAFDEKILHISKTHINEGDGSEREVFSHPLKKLYLYGRAENGQLTSGRIEKVKLFLIIAVLILVIACINFMNLSTARSEKRAKEVGVRRIAGASYPSLITQFISESTILAFISFILAVLFVQFTLPIFGSVVGTSFHLDFGNPLYWAFAAGFIVLTGLLAGSYPAFYLSSAQPVKVLKGTFKQAGARVSPRKVLVILQFTVAITMIICTINVRRQVQYAQSRDAGYNRSELGFNFMQGDILKNYEAIKNDLVSSRTITSMSKTYSPITRVWEVRTGLKWQGSTEADKKTSFLVFGSDKDFTKTLGTHLIQGRDLDIDTYPNDTLSLILNETAVRIMNLKDPLGQTIDDETGKRRQVVGVVKDFIMESPYENVKPMIIEGWTPRYGAVHYRLNPEHDRQTNLAEAARVFRKYNPEYPFELLMADESYEQKFGDEKQTGALVSLFTGLTIFISCLGLFALAAYMAENRTKEIGVRKVLGASITSITGLISKEFIFLILISFLIAAPVSWYLVNSWLQEFTYRVPMSLWVFVVSGVGCLAIALATISYQAIKAALTNPVDSLRME